MIVQHLLPDLPGQILVGRRVEQFLDPCREQGLVGAVPAVAHLPDASRRGAQGLRLAGGYNDIAGDRAAIRRRRLAVQPRVPGAGGGCCDLGEPGIRRTAVAAGRFDRDAPIGCDQRQCALDRLLGDDHDAQRRAAPGRHRRRQDGDLGGVRADGCRCGRGWRESEQRDEKSACDQQECRCSGSRAAHRKHLMITLLKCTRNSCSALPADGSPDSE